MKQKHFEYYYNEKISGFEKKQIDEIMNGKPFDELSVAKKVAISLICIPDEINFFGSDNNILKFYNDSTEYELLDKMSAEEYVIYIDLMCLRGITVEYDSAFDYWMVY